MTTTSAPRPHTDGVEFAATHRAPVTAGRVDPRVPTLAELRTAGMVPLAPAQDPRDGQLDRAVTLAVSSAVRVQHLEATAERLADRVRVESMARTAAERELAGARVIIEARDNRLAQLEAALERRNRQLAVATDAAEAYREERDAARSTIDAIGRLVDPLD